MRIKGQQIFSKYFHGKKEQGEGWGTGMDGNNREIKGHKAMISFLFSKYITKSQSASFFSDSLIPLLTC